jgi:hypothetical protein
MDKHNVVWCIYTMKILFSHERNAVDSHATAWINPENTMLSGRSQTQKTTDFMSPWMGNVQDR